MKEELINKKIVIELFLFIFSMIFLNEISGIDLRIFIAFFWISISLYKLKNQTIKIQRPAIFILFSIGIIIIYSFIVILITQTNYIFIPMRYVRSLLSVITVVLYLRATKFNLNEFLYALVFSLLIHSGAILLEMINPDSAQYIRIISGYTKKELGYRASGLVSGYDFAGMYAVVGLYISIILAKLTGINTKKILLLFIFGISILFTSRFTLILLVFSLIYYFISIKKINTRAKRKFIFIVILIAIFLGGIFFILSTEIAPEVRMYILRMNPWLNNLYTNLVYSYANYDISSLVNEQFLLPAYDFRLLFGLGERAPVDPGYINIIYNIGILGMSLMFFTYFIIFCFTMRKSEGKVEKKIIKHLVLFLLVVSFIMEFKLIFLFSSGIFEMLVISFFVYVKNQEVEL